MVFTNQNQTRHAKCESKPEPRKLHIHVSQKSLFVPPGSMWYYAHSNAADDYGDGDDESNEREWIVKIWI